MENTLSTIIEGTNGELSSQCAKLVIINEKLFVFLPKDNFKMVQETLKTVGFRINGNETINTITDVCYPVTILSDCIKHKFKLTNDVNGNVKVEFKKTAENGGYYYFGQMSPIEVEKVMLKFIDLSLEGFSDEEICKLFERKYRRK